MTESVWRIKVNARVSDFKTIYISFRWNVNTRLVKSERFPEIRNTTDRSNESLIVRGGATYDPPTRYTTATAIKRISPYTNHTTNFFTICQIYLTMTLHPLRPSRVLRWNRIWARRHTRNKMEEKQQQGRKSVREYRSAARYRSRERKSTNKKREREKGKQNAWLLSGAFWLIKFAFVSLWRRARIIRLCFGARRSLDKP